VNPSRRKCSLIEDLKISRATHCRMCCHNAHDTQNCYWLATVRKWTVITSLWMRSLLLSFSRRMRFSSWVSLSLSPASLMANISLLISSFMCSACELETLPSLSTIMHHLTLCRPLLPYGYSYRHFVIDRVEPSFVIFTSGHSDAQGWASECLDVKNYKWRLNPV